MINWDKPYEKVCGHPFVKYVQDGESFFKDGRNINDPEPVEEEPEEKIVEEKTDIPEFISNPPKMNKKPSNMDEDECKAELDYKGISYGKKERLWQLRKKVHDNR